MEKTKRDTEKQNAWGTARTLLRTAWQFDRTILIMIGLQVVFAVLAAFGGVALPGVVIGALTGTNGLRQIILTICIAFLIFGALQAAATYFTERNGFQYIELRLHHFWKKTLLAGIECDYEMYSKKETKDMINKGVNEGLTGNNIGVEGFYHDFAKLLTAMLGVVVYATVIGYVSVWLILLLMGLSALSYLTYMMTRKKGWALREEMTEDEMHIYYFKNLAYDVVAGKDVRLYQIHPFLHQAFDTINRRMRRNCTSRQRYMNAYRLVTEVVSFLRDGACFALLIYRMAQGEMSVASFVFYLGVVSGFSIWFTQMVTQLAEVQTRLTQSGLFFDVLNAMQPPTGEEALPAETGEIVFDHVGYTYPESESESDQEQEADTSRQAGEPVLKDFNLTIAPGETIALVGANGAGKTTIVKLLTGLFRPTKGRILIGGKDLSTLDKRAWQDRLGVIFQDTHFFSVSIAENIACAPADEVDENRVMEAVERAGLKEKIDALSDGIHTFIGKDIEETGIQMSGGETQKMLLARAFYRDPELMILDEPTAALDALAEQELYLQYNSFIKDKTALFISHRLASTRFCDRIVLIDQGVIAEEGTHEELMEKKGLYFKMFEAQSKYYREETA